jgi:hypothetical protein
MACNCKKKVEDYRTIQIQENIEKSKNDLESIIERLSQKIYELQKETENKKTDQKEFLSFKDGK